MFSLFVWGKIIIRNRLNPRIEHEFKVETEVQLIQYFKDFLSQNKCGADTKCNALDLGAFGLVGLHLNAKAAQITYTKWTNNINVTYKLLLTTHNTHMIQIFAYKWTFITKIINK